VYGSRYISDRFLPDKAIDLVDEAASALRLAQESKPDELEALDREIITLQVITSQGVPDLSTVLDALFHRLNLKASRTKLIFSAASAKLVSSKLLKTGERRRRS
jgi:ATP-dependent Clp protease ATP-binding subunit ClpA